MMKKKKKIAGGKAVIYRIFEVNVAVQRSRDWRCAIWPAIARIERRWAKREREKETIAWEAIGIAWILYRSGKRGRDAASWLTGLAWFMWSSVKGCALIAKNRVSWPRLVMFIRSGLDCSVSSFSRGVSTFDGESRWCSDGRWYLLV